MSPKQIAKVAKALADDNRLQIYRSIATEQEINCGDICSAQVVGHATVSHHLRILTEAGLIDSRRQGQFIYYRVIRKTLREFNKSLTDLTKQQEAS